MSVEYSLDLRREDVETGGFNQTFESIGKIEESVCLHSAEVAGMQPHAVVVMQPQGLLGRLRVIQIADHDRRSRHADLAFAARRQLLGRTWPADLGERVGEGDADAAFAILVERHRHDRGYRFLETVALAQLHLPTLPHDHLLKSLLRRPRRADTLPRQRSIGDRRLDREEARLHDISLTASPVNDAHGRIVGASKIAQGITYQRQTQDRLAADQQAMTMLREVGSLCAREGKSLDRCLHEILGVAIAIARSDKGTINCSNRKRAYRP
jgi:hypothetical protein